MNADHAPRHRRTRTWRVATAALFALAVLAVVADVAAWLQAVTVAVTVAAATMVVHVGTGATSVAQAERARSDPGVPLERRVAGQLARRPMGRRSALGLVGLGVVGGAAALRWLGPRPATGTTWRAGRRLVTNDGDPLRPVDVPPGGVVTVWPEGSVGAELTAVMLIRLRQRPTPPTRLDHVVDGTLVAYSRICTHAGCPVALYRDRDQALFCPCHQATFDALAGARPVFGPASRPLPQLPLGVDEVGYLVAQGDFAVLPGPPGGGP